MFVPELVFSTFSGGDSPAKGRFNVGAYEPIKLFSLCHSRDPALGQADGDIDAVGGEGGDHCAGAGGEWDELNGEGMGGFEVREDLALEEVERDGEVFGDVAHPEGLG